MASERTKEWKAIKTETKQGEVVARSFSNRTMRRRARAQQKKALKGIKQ